MELSSVSWLDNIAHFIGNFTYTGGNLKITNSDESLNLNGASKLGQALANPAAAGTRTLDLAGAIDFSGTIAGTGGLIKSGPGSLTLSSANTFSGDTSVEGGTLMLNHLNALQNSTLIPSAGLSFGSLTAANLGGLAGSQNLALVNASSTAVALSVGNNNASTSFSGVLSGAGSLTKTGDGTLTLTGNNTYTGGTTVSAGSLRLGAGGSAGSVIGNIINNGTVIFNRSGDYTFGGVISGTGAMVNDGSILRFSNQQTYTGPTTLNSGIFVLPITVDNALSASTAVYLAEGAQLDISNRPQTFAGLTGEGTVYSFPAAGGSGGHLKLDISDHQTFAGVLGGAFPNFALTKDGEGTLTLAGNNTYTGTTTVNQGTLEFTAGLPSTGAEILVAQTGTLAISGTVTRNLRNNANVTALGGSPLTLSGVVSGNGNFAGDFIFSGTTRPGNSAGRIGVDGDLTFASAHTLEVEIGGTTPGTEHDQIEVSDSLTVGGAAVIRLIDGFIPEKGDEFVILTANSFTGDFSGIDLSNAELPVGLFWETSDFNTTGIIRVSGFTFASWADDFGFAADPDGDPLGDGIPLLIKYALGLDPTVRASREAMPSFTITEENGEKFPALAVNRTVVRDDVGIIGEVSEDLIDWTATGVDLIEDTPGQLIFRDSTHITSGARRFLRVKFELIP